MKKGFFYLGFAALMMSGFVSCNNDDEPNGGEMEIPVVSHGAYILNQGAYYTKVEGSLNLLDYATSTVTTDLFIKANGRSLGDTPQCVVLYGSKIYIGVYGSKTIEILDRYTYKSIKQISLQDSENGTEPRSMAVKDGKVYISMYDGYIARLDTLSQTIDASVKVGVNPENIAILGNNIYVPNSEGMNWQIKYGETASVVSIEPFQEVTRFDVPLNPNKFFTNGTDLYLLSMGDYGEVAAAVYKINTSDYTYEEVTKATMANIKGDELYILNAPYYSAVETYTSSKIDLKTGKTTATFDLSYVDYPSGIGVDPQSGKFFITSCPMDGAYASYTTPGHAIEYDSNGTFVKKYQIGCGTAILFFDVD